MRSVEFHPAARAEYIEAARFYAAESSAVQFRFMTAVDHALQRIGQYPERGAPFGGRLRRSLVPRFPYGLLYRIEPDRLFIVAVMHLHRRPGYWRSRL